jgi:16S rRNA (uracil1498-N3)-methyltransferase
MAERFFSAAPLTADKATLAGPEAHHLAHVVRATPGAEVVLFDGAGIEAVARVDGVARSRVELSVLSRRAVNRERSVEITLAVALPKGDRQRWLVEKAVELGVRRLLPLATRRGVAEATPAALDRLRRAVIEACKQCGRNTLLEIAAPQNWADFAASSAAGVRWLAHPGGQSLLRTTRQMAAAPSSPAAFALAIGPEGGFTPEEITVGIDSGWQTVDLGPAILRVETAAVFLVAAACLAGLDGDDTVNGER